MDDIEGHYICEFDPKDLADKLKLAIAFGKRTEGRKRIIELGLDNKQVAQKLIDIYKSCI